MNAAIITYHRAVNYGSALQAYALNRYINELGIHCETIDYRPKRQSDIYRLFEAPKSPMALARNVHSLLCLRDLRTHQARFDEFLNDLVIQTVDTFSKPTDLEALGEHYDVYVTGSDQVWNPRTTDFDSSYLLSFVHDKSRCLSYAPSLGTGALPAEYHDLFRKELAGYRRLSVREEQGATAISEVVGRAVSTVVDPVFLLNGQDWSCVGKTASCTYGGDFIFGYFIGDVPGMREFTDKLAEETGLKVITVYKNLRDLLHRTERHYDAGPREFIWYVAHARYVVTNSFHATAFSIIYRKDFWTFVDSNSDAPGERIRNILNLTNLNNRSLDNARSASVAATEPVCWPDKGIAHLADSIDASKHYLKEGLLHAM